MDYPLPECINLIYYDAFDPSAQPDYGRKKAS